MDNPLVRVVGIHHAHSCAWLRPLLEEEGPVEAMLTWESANEYDPRAVSVWYEGKKVGYLPKNTTNLYPDLDGAGISSWYEDFLDSGLPDKSRICLRVTQLSVLLQECGEYEAYGELKGIDV